LTYKEKIKMEILSFVLGISAVLVVALVTVGVVAFVKVIKLKKEVTNINSDMEENLASTYTYVNERFDDIERMIGENQDEASNMDQEILSKIDSVHDKLYDKITKVMIEVELNKKEK
jgi:hypothetical protein